MGGGYGAQGRIRGWTAVRGLDHGSGPIQWVRVVIEPVVENGWVQSYSLFAPDWPGCVASADTVQEAVDLMRQSLSWHLQAVSGVSGG